MKRFIGRFCIGAGCLLVIGAFALTGYNFYQDGEAGRASEEALVSVKAEIEAHSLQGVIDRVNDARYAGMDRDGHDQFIGVETVAITPDYQVAPDLIEMPTVSATIGVGDGTRTSKYVGYLYFPKLDLELPVLSEFSDDGLHIAPCRYSGSVYTGNMIVMAHNNQKHFGYVRNKLFRGDKVEFTDADGNVFLYKITDKETLDETDVAGMNAGIWDMTLITCTPGGRQRVAVRCELI